jgi:hypothetical protein
MVVHVDVDEVIQMAARAGGKPKGDAMPRMSVSFPADVYILLADLATKKKVSIGWVGREAVDNYLSDQSPLFGSGLAKEGQEMPRRR